MYIYFFFISNSPINFFYIHLFFLNIYTFFNFSSSLAFSSPHYPHFNIVIHLSLHLPLFVSSYPFPLTINLLLFSIYILLKTEAWYLLLLSSCCATSSPRHLPHNNYLLFIPISFKIKNLNRLLTLHIHLCWF